MRRTALALAVLASLHAESLLARTPETAIDPNQGIWIAQGDKFIYQTIDRWSVFSAGATVSKLVVDQNTDPWCRSDVGLSRFRILQRVSNNFPMSLMGAQQIFVTAVDGQARG
jgi:ligand-binding sensor domain-containing protein